MLTNGNDNASASTSSFAQTSLEELLTATELLSYHDALKNVLKLRHAGDIGDTDRTDLDGIGMSRPEQRRLMREYAKHFALDQRRQQSSVVWKKFRLKMFGDAKPGKQRKIPGGEGAHPPNGQTSTAQPQHIIPIERITLCKKVGTGEFGHVFQAVWHNTAANGREAATQQVAVKRILPEKLISQQTSFLQEAAIMTRMHHPNVIRLFGVVLQTNAVMLVSELAPCGSLLDCLQCPSWREPFSVTVLSDFALQIAQGMRYLCCHRLIHRDLAARNVLVCSPSKVKISDFGLSRCLGHGEDYYRSEFSPSMKLPIAWCAPECINFLRFTSASDVWSYGVCLWEMFSYGKTPWEGMSGSQILHSIDTQRKKLHCPEACPREVYLLMLSCWEWEAHIRPNFEQICDRLPSMVPPLLVTISESGTTKSGHLNYTRDETIVLLDKNPCGNAGLWLGISKSAKVGLFRPEDTIAYLGAENPSPSSKSSDLLTEKTKVKSKKKKTAVDIGPPRGDLRHTCHVGADGRSFGLLNVHKNDLARTLPPEVSPRFSHSRGINAHKNDIASGGVMILPPLMSTSMVSLPPPRPPRRENGTNSKPGAPPMGTEMDDAMSRSVCLGQITAEHSSAEYLNSSSAASLSPPALPPKPPRFRSFANFSDQPPLSPSAPAVATSPLTTQSQMEYNQQFSTDPPVQIQNWDQIHPPEPIHHQSPPPFPLETIQEGKSIQTKKGTQNKSESSQNGREERVKVDEEEKLDQPEDNKDHHYDGREKEEDAEEEEEEEEDDSLIQRPSSVCCEFNSGATKCEWGQEEAEEKRILQVLTDLQRDLTNFSLSSLEDCSDGRPLLDGEERRANRNQSLMEEQKRHLRELSLERHGIITGHSSDIVGMGRTELERRANEERKKVLKKLTRHGGEESGADEKRISVVGSFISSASKMFVGGTSDRTHDKECEQYQQRNNKGLLMMNNGGTNSSPPKMAFPPSSKEPLTNWPPEAQEAYKLLVQCGHTLRGTSMVGDHFEQRNASTGATIGQMAETIELPKKIEYINSLLVGWEGGGERRNERKSLDSESRTMQNGAIVNNSEMALHTQTMAFAQNELRSPPPVPPKPKTRIEIMN